MARAFFKFNPMPVVLFVGAVVIGVPAALIMLTTWLHIDSDEKAFVDEIESKIGPIDQPREVVKDGKDLCDSYEFESDGMSEFNDASRVHDIRVTDFGAVHGDRGTELTDKEALVIVKASKKHLCDTSE